MRFLISEQATLNELRKGFVSLDLDLEPAEIVGVFFDEAAHGLPFCRSVLRQPAADTWCIGVKVSTIANYTNFSHIF